MKKHNVIHSLAKEYVEKWEKEIEDKTSVSKWYYHKIDDEWSKRQAFSLVIDLCKYNKEIWMEALILKTRIENCF